MDPPSYNSANLRLSFQELRSQILANGSVLDDFGGVQHFHNKLEIILARPCTTGTGKQPADSRVQGHYASLVCCKGSSNVAPWAKGPVRPTVIEALEALLEVTEIIADEVMRVHETDDEKSCFARKKNCNCRFTSAARVASEGL